MATHINHDLRVVNGGTLYMPQWFEGEEEWGNLALPDVYAIGTTQLYPISTVYRVGLKTFIYSKCAASGYGTSGAGIMAGACMESTGEILVLADSVTAGAADQNVITVTTTDSTTLNEYAGGQIGIIQAAGGLTTVGRGSTFGILSNTVHDSNSVDFTLDGNLVNVFGTGDDVVLSKNPYAEVRTVGVSGNFQMCVGINVCTTVASSYLWLQTGGPNNCLIMMIAFEGGAANSVPVFSVAGTPQVCEGGATGNATTNGIDGTCLQIIGYVCASTVIGGVSGTPADISISPTVFLTIFN